MTRPPRICTFISRSVLSLVLLLGLCVSASAQGFLRFEADTVPMFRGFSVATDMVGLAQTVLSDYGQYEGALRVNLHDQYFPTVEIGYGRANHEDDEVTGITYKARGPYFRLGADVNMMKRKHTGNRIYAGLRYAYAKYTVDMSRPLLLDPVWGGQSWWGVDGQSCWQHWAEVVVGIYAKVAGPLHMGWSVRYRRRLAHEDGPTDKTWYVPGFGTQGSTKLGVLFNIGIDI